MYFYFVRECVQWRSGEKEGREEKSSSVERGEKVKGVIKSESQRDERRRTRGDFGQMKEDVGPCSFSKCRTGL